MSCSVCGREACAFIPEQRLCKFGVMVPAGIAGWFQRRGALRTGLEKTTRYLREHGRDITTADVTVTPWIVREGVPDERGRVKKWATAEIHVRFPKE